MDTQRDFAPFRELLDQLRASLGGGDFKASDAMVKAYWDALKDVPLAEVREAVKHLIATAKADTPFPRPSMLRRSANAQRAPMFDPAHERADRSSSFRWEQLRKHDVVEFTLQTRIARLARELLTLAPEDPGYQEAEREQGRWYRLRYAPRAEQEAAVRAHLGTEK
jgi:hypothetical protein